MLEIATGAALVCALLALTSGPVLIDFDKAYLYAGHAAITLVRVLTIVAGKSAAAPVDAPVAVEAATMAAEKGRSVEVIDLRTLLPLDAATMLASVRKTGRVVIVHEAPRTCGYGAELAALIAEQALTSLQAPVLRVTGYDTPFPYTLEHAYLPDAPRVFAAIEHAMSY